MAGPSATGNFAKAGIAAARENEKILKSTLEHSPNMGEIVQEAAIRRGKENVAALRAETAVQVAGMQETTKTKANKTVNDAAWDLKKAKRKAGVLASAGSLLGTGIAGLGRKPEKRRVVGESSSIYNEMIERNKSKADALRTEAEGITAEPFTYSPTPLSTSAPVQNTEGSTNNDGFSASPQGSTLTGVRKEFADAIAGPESGSWGYEAFNQGGAAGGTVVLGKSGSHKETFGRSLTDMTLGEIFQKQNMGGSNAEFQANGGLHAVGRYQFIGSTLQDEVSKMGLSLDTKFTPEVQDAIFFNHAKRIGDISPWIGPSVNYDQSKKNHLNSLIPQL